MPHTIAERVRQWSRELDTTDYRAIQSQIEFLAERLYRQYEPCVAPFHKEFKYRLRDWLDSTPSAIDQQRMLELVPEILFVGTAEFESLSRAAFNGPIYWWLVEQLDLRIDQDIELELARALKHTWVCPVTDSMLIAKFYHVNNISGFDLRPDWRSLARFSQSPDGAETLDLYMQGKKIERIVLLEDFVGSGSQMAKAVKFALSLPGDRPVLLCPLVVCPVGHRYGQWLERRYGPRLRYVPVLKIPRDEFLTRRPLPGEHASTTSLRALVERVHALVVGATQVSDVSPYGFRHTGATIVLHSNCPNNTIPLLHHDRKGDWRPLFPRSSRL